MIGLSIRIPSTLEEGAKSRSFVEPAMSVIHTVATIDSLPPYPAAPANMTQVPRRPARSYCQTVRLAVVVVALAFFGTACIRFVFAPAPGPTHDNFARLRPFMSQQQVERILGPYHLETGRGLCAWIGDDCKIDVWFEEKQGVYRVYDGCIYGFNGTRLRLQAASCDTLNTILVKLNWFW
jgi:hypothetical protein